MGRARQPIVRAPVSSRAPCRPAPRTPRVSAGGAHRPWIAGLLALVALLPGAAARSAPPLPSTPMTPTTPAVRSIVRLHETHAHRIHVETTVEHVDGETLDVSMPVWTPGSYLVREYARHVLDLAARDADGAPLPVTKLDKNTWRVTTRGSATVTVSYALHANERSVRTNHADADHAFLSPAGVFMRVSDRPDAPHRITVEAPDEWEVFTSLPRDGQAFVAADFDVLVDSPLEVGPHEVLAFEHDGVPHRIVLAGDNELDRDVLLTDVTAIVAEVASVFGHMPFEDYTFILAFVDSGGGGLEHLASSVCMIDRWAVTSSADKYRNVLSLIAHEYFHAWNVKRFRPEALGPFDYDREVYTRDLWVAEGVTSYYDDLCTLRAGYYPDAKKYLEERANAFRKEAERPASQRMSMAQSSHDAWIKLYRPDENSANSTISYYSKGALVAMMLDLRILRLTAGRAGLRDVLRLGWETYTTQGIGFPEGAFQQLASEVAGEDLASFFDAYVRGTDPLAPDDDLRWVGLRLTVKPKAPGDRRLEEDADGFPLEPRLGLDTSGANGLCKIDAVLEGGPAWSAGLNPDDLLLAIDGMRVSPGDLRDRLDRAGGGGPVEVTFFRGQSLRRVLVEPELRRLEDWSLEPLDEVTDEQAAAYEAWLGSKHPSRS